MERAPHEEEFEEWDEFAYSDLYEAALRLLAALGAEGRFPSDVEGCEALIARAVADPGTEVMRFRVEPPGALPRYSGRWVNWVCPTGDGSLRLRFESGAMEAYAATLAPDGSFRDFAHERGFGVPDSELTPRARADRQEVERRVREEEAAAREAERRADEGQRRFLVERLRGVAAGPWQDPTGPVVAWVAFYDSGFIVSIVVPEAADRERPGLEVVDDVGDAYEAIDVVDMQRHRPTHHYLYGFGPAVPDGARRLILRGDGGSVDVEVVR